MATQNVDVLQVNTKPSVTSISALRKEIKDLKGQLLSLEQGTAEYNKVLSEVADKTHQLKEIQEQVSKSSSDFGDRISNVQGAVAGLSGAFQTALGTLSLLGVEIGDDVKMLKLLQSAMAITQGVAAIDTGVKAFRALSVSIRASVTAMSGLQKALLTSGIGAAAVAVGVLVAKLSELKKQQDEAREAARKHNEELREQLKITNQIAKAESSYYNDQYKQLPIISALENKLADNRAYWQEEYNKGRINAYELDKRIEDERLRYVTNAGQKMQQTWQTILSHNTEENWKASEEGRKAWNEYYQWRAVAAYGDLDQQKALMKEWEDFTADAAKNVKKTVADTTKEAVKTQPTLQLPEYDTFTDPMVEQKRQEEELKALTEYYAKRADIIIANETNVDDQLLKLDMQYRDQREELLRKRFEDGLISQEEFDNEIAQLEVEAAELQIEQEERVTEKTKDELEKRKKLQENYLNAVKSIIGSIAGILSSLGSTLEQGSKEWKNVMTAEAIISTIKGGIDAYMGMIKTLPGIPGIVAGAAAALATVTAGMAEVYKIQHTDISKGGSSSGSSSSSFGSVSASAVNVNATSVTPTRTVQTEEDIANLPDTRVYVTEEDITNAQRRVRVTHQNATY